VQERRSSAYCRCVTGSTTIACASPSAEHVARGEGNRALQAREDRLERDRLGHSGLDLVSIRSVYETLAAVYDWLVPDPLLTPEGRAQAFAPLLEPGARVLDCAAGTGTLAVGLALAGFSVDASDASPEMIRRTRALAAARGVVLRADARAWADLHGGPYDAVLCVGNSLTHAEGRRGRRTALSAMARVLRPGGLLVLTSRNWELVRARRPGLELAERLVERGGVLGLVVRNWTIPERWTEPHLMDTAVALLDGAGGVTTHAERLTFWPFTHETLDADLRAAGLRPGESSYAPAAERYLITASR
jgi:SAM-dependent methyltransferase